MRTNKCLINWLLILRKPFVLIAILSPVLLQAQTKPFHLVTKLYPLDLFYPRFHAFHGGLELYKKPFSLHLSYGFNAGPKLTHRHERYHKGYSYKAAMRYYSVLKGTVVARRYLKSPFYVELAYRYLDYTQPKENSRYTNQNGDLLSYQTGILRTRKTGIELLVGKHFPLYTKVTVECSFGLAVGSIENYYSQLTNVMPASTPPDNFGWLFLSNPKLMNEGKFRVISPRANIGFAYWL